MTLWHLGDGIRSWLLCVLWRKPSLAGQSSELLPFKILQLLPHSPNVLQQAAKGHSYLIHSCPCNFSLFLFTSDIEVHTKFESVFLTSKYKPWLEKTEPLGDANLLSLKSILLQFLSLSTQVGMPMCVI